ncbi:MAG: transcription-repair coupling factor, partial [Gammaproteobacteria bacterium]|nr:transcription-repair coupling factor [Gammaproteobacteria bacterium]
LGTDQWARARQKAAEQIRDVAADLLDLYATREARSGRSMRINPADYEQFAAGFPFELTEDQAYAIDATLADLRSPQSMDRLVCGDVGFGKTEVALRAAFVAAMSGAQVTLLAPTTLLAQQHYQTFSDRLADWPLTVEVLSRFRTVRESREVVAGLRSGKVDIVIGTHKLLQDDVKFNDLGLVIVDEEHRFGVRHKEALKNLRAEVDMLTLTATPIPRTLNMALGELRELSLITTPPETRLAIKTFVTQWQTPMIREACQREMKRGGQIYFVHNRVQDIEKQAARLQDIVPEANIRIAHGQMREQELEQIMLDFAHRRFHILVCTSIIESGIDIPSANTIIINRADHFGLAQLHQLRGRVGRSHHKAFAYLIAPPDNLITADAAKRLDAIEAMEDLGAGFVLATHDLEIRGAGELLGEQQTGQLQQIGFSLYTELLGRAVAAIRRGDTPDLDATRQRDCEVNMHLPALLPEDYMPDIQMRLVHYKRIASAADDDALRELQVELIDRFGLLPDPTRNLFRQARLRLLAEPLGLRKVEATAGGIVFTFGDKPGIDTSVLVRLIGQEPDRYGFDRKQRFIVTADLSDADRRFTTVEAILNDWHRDHDASAASV